MVNYQIKIRAVAGKTYIKVFLTNTTNIKLIQSILKRLDSVSVVNITETKNGKNLTVYKDRGYAIDDTQADVKKALDEFFKDILKGNNTVYNKKVFYSLYSNYPDVGNLVKSGFRLANIEAEY